MTNCALNPRPALVAFLLLVMLTATSAVAGPRNHEDGFFLRLSAGGGSLTSTLEGDDNKIEMEGSAADLNVAIGGMVAPNLALHGTLFGWSTSEPTVELNGTVLGDIEGDVRTSALGIGLTYYFMPVNLYLSGSLGAGQMSIKVNALTGETDAGLFTDLTLGKEWWVGDKWALGIAGGVQYHRFGDSDSDVTWEGTSYAIRFTASMN